MQNSGRTYIAYTFCFLSFAAFGFYQMQFNTKVPSEMAEFASTVEFETPQQCGADRNYFEQDLKKVSLDFRQTRNQVGQDQPPRACVTHIMKTFMPLDIPKSSRGMCVDANGNQLGAPTKGPANAGFKAACVTETYVNSVYNSMLDVTDCFNIPMKELLPKLYNESGLHLNTLGPSNDTGIGQLTKSALADDVFEPYIDKFGDGKKRGPRLNQQSGYEYYIQELKKSSKPSCQRIANLKSVIDLLPVDGGAASGASTDRNKVKALKMCDSKYAAESADPTCFKAWEFENRCIFMNAPQNPLLNVLTMAMLYRNNLKNATGITFVAGDDMLSQRPYRPGEPLNGYFASGKYIERLKNLGVQNPNQETLKQIIISLGFNSGIGTSKKIFEDYLTVREALKVKLSDRDFNFQEVGSSQWAFLTTPISGLFWKGLATSDKDDIKKAVQAFDALTSVGIDAKGEAEAYEGLRKKVQKQIADISDAGKAELQLEMDKYRASLFLKVAAKAGRLSFPEYARIYHAYLISTNRRKYGGAPGYLSALSSRYLLLEKDMGRGACTPDQYLKF